MREFLRWMEAEGLAASTRSTVLSAIRSVQPANPALSAIRIKVPHRSVQEEVLSKGEIVRVLEDIRTHEQWLYPVFALWLGTGLRNAELIGLTWDCVRLEEGELLPRLRADSAKPDERALPGKVPMAQRSMDSASCISTMPLFMLSRDELLSAEVRCALIAADVER